MDRTIALGTGELRIAVQESELPLDALCGFAARINRRRGFLFVSKLLGRHIPATPQAMRDSYQRLAARLNADAPGPVLVVGMAETACGLGEGVFEAYCARTGRADVAYLSTTRFLRDEGPLLSFDEPHSHATDHRLYRGEVIPAGFWDDVQSVVLVDDEATTGATFRNLHHALAAVLPRLTHAECAVLTDWSGGALTEPPVRALLRGAFVWRPAAIVDGAPPPEPTAYDPPVADARVMRVAGGQWGAFGPTALCVDHPPDRQARRADAGPARVLGYGECVHQPFLYAEALAADGRPTTVQAITRSPIRVGHAIESRIDAPDAYGAGVAYHLYNHDLAGETILVHDLREPDRLAPLMAAVRADRAVRVGAALA